MRRSPALVLILGVLATVATFSAEAATPPATFTLEQVLSSPFPDNLVASPSGASLAWTFNANGARNVWVAQPPEYKGRAVTSYTGDDGQELAGLVFTPDGKSVVYVRGGDANRKGEHPNPLHRPDGVEQALWIVGLDGTAPRKLADGSSPAVSPRGDRVAFLAKGQVWSVPLSGDGKAEQLIAARGEADSLRWSPDGARLAFVSLRGDHSYVGVYDVAGKSVRYLDPGVDRDLDPAWSPDGKRVAFVRIPSSKELQVFRAHREGAPWSMRVADAATGAGKLAFRADPGRGSVFREIVAPNQILWADGDRIVFPWEKDGWTHLYSVPAIGGAATLLTPGAFEVEYVALSPDRKSVLFNSNQDDIERRHLWTVPAAGGKPAALTSGVGFEWLPVQTSDGKALAFIRSDAKKPARPAIQVGSAAARDLAPGAIPVDFPETALVTPETIVFSASDGMKIHGQLFLPPDLKAGERRPALLFFHGGSRRQMLPGWHYMDYYHNAYAFNQYLASRGFIVLSVNYRSGIGYGMEFREALDYGASGASEYHDVEGAGLYLRGRADVDPNRIGLWGGSYGGYLTALGLARASELFAAGVDFHGVHDWNVVIKNFEPTYDPDAHRDAARLAFESSPMADVKSWRSPVLLIHGDDDRNVPFSETVDIVEPLRRQGVEVEQLIFPDEVHDIDVHGNWIAAYRAAEAFLARYLQAPAAR